MQYKTRLFEGSDWQKLKAIRLEALQQDPTVFGGDYSTENQFSNDEWRLRATPGQRCMFGLYDVDQIIGLTGVLTDRDDASGQTACLIASYIRPTYRGQGLAKLLYQARLQWIAAQNRFTTVITSHRAGNEASRRANQQWGFEHWKTADKTWPDGLTAPEIFYRLAVEDIPQKLAAYTAQSLPSL